MSWVQKVRSNTSRVVGVIGEIFGLLLQFILVLIGGSIIWGDDNDDVNLARLIIWCVIATFYLMLTVIWLNIIVRLGEPDSREFRAVVANPIARILSNVLTFGASLIGLTVALELIAQLGHNVNDRVSQGAAVWAMLLSWALFNWGFARIYYARYHRSPQPPLEFPDTPDPRFTDFVYFSFTNATTFAVSDVRVTSPRVRWTVVWHTSMAFFFNALIIVLTMNVLTRGTLFADLL